MAESGPLSVELFPYRVGFGDCFLLRFEYPDRPRHVLIDFGSTAPASKRIGYQMEQIAFHIWGVVTDGGSEPDRKLDAIVATHRHKDHISGFAGKSWEYLAALQPQLVLLPWTEHPDAAADATAAPEIAAGTMGLASAQYVGALDAMQDLSKAALEELAAKGDQETLAEVAAADQPPAEDGEEQDDGPDRKSVV